MIQKYNQPLNLFVSYCHKDSKSVESFLKHTKKTLDDNVIDVWYDKRISAGDNFWEQIENKIQQSDIICLFISADYLASDSCNKERVKAMELRQKKGVVVVPIILSHCAWLEYDDLNKTLAIPSDGKPISSFGDPNEGWFDVNIHMKNVFNDIIKIKSLHFTADFSKNLNDATLLTKAHPNKNDVRMEDIFVYVVY